MVNEILRYVITYVLDECDICIVEPIQCERREVWTVWS